MAATQHSMALANGTCQWHLEETVELVRNHEITDWTDLGREMWSFLTGREAAINYTFRDLVVEVPRDTGAQAPRATWRFNGTLSVTTSEQTSDQTSEAG